MKKCFFYLLLSFVSSLVRAELPERFATEEARQEEHVRLSDLRQKMDAAYSQDVKQCYQQFDVNSCKAQALERRIVTNTKLRKEELLLKSVERQLKAEDARGRLAERQNEAERKKDEVEHAAAAVDAITHADDNAKKKLEHKLKGSKRGEYEQKQIDAAQHRANVEKKLRDKQKDPVAPLPIPTR